jgi:hypothetical protein
MFSDNLINYKRRRRAVKKRTINSNDNQQQQQQQLTLSNEWQIPTKDTIMDINNNKTSFQKSDYKQSKKNDQKQYNSNHLQSSKLNKNKSTVPVSINNNNNNISPSSSSSISSPSSSPASSTNLSNSNINELSMRNRQNNHQQFLPNSSQFTNHLFSNPQLDFNSLNNLVQDNLRLNFKQCLEVKQTNKQNHFN